MSAAAGAAAAAQVARWVGALVAGARDRRDRRAAWRRVWYLAYWAPAAGGVVWVLVPRRVLRDLEVARAEARRAGRRGEKYAAPTQRADGRAGSVWGPAVARSVVAGWMPASAAEHPDQFFAGGARGVVLATGRPLTVGIAAGDIMRPGRWAPDTDAAVRIALQYATAAQQQGIYGEA